MKFAFVSIGKLKDPNLKNLASDYFERIQRYCKSQIIELREDKGISSKDSAKITKKEGESILAQTGGENHYSIALDVKGRSFTTEEFAGHIGKLMNRGFKQISFIIGGPFGLSEDVKQRSNEMMSLSNMTLPHELAKVVLLEQVYRALTIIKGHKYHY